MGSRGECSGSARDLDRKSDPNECIRGLPNNNKTTNIAQVRSQKYRKIVKAK